MFAVRNSENNISNPNRRYHPTLREFLGYDPQVRIKEFYGERILSYLNSHGLSRSQPASQLGVTPQTIHKWIHNMSSLPVRFVTKLVSVIGSRTLGQMTPKQKM